MKSFFNFFKEATEAGAAAQAKKLGLKSDGHGGWVNAQGKFIAKTEGDRLKFFGSRGKAQPEDPKKPKTAQAQPAPKQKVKPAPAPLKVPKKAEDEKGDGKGGEEAVTIVFGRFNPPTVGHEKLLKTAEKISVGGDLKIYPSRSVDPKKNPLETDDKISFMRKMFPDYGEKIINDPDMKTIFDVMVNASEKGYKNVNIVVGADRQSEFDSLAQKYNGDLYNFDQIRTVSAGVRDADAAGVEGMSASKMRKAVQDDDFKAFRKGTPKSLDDAETQTLFQQIRRGMGVKKVKDETKIDTAVTEGLWQIAPKLDKKGLRDNYIRENIYRLGDVVEHLNTGLVGTIVRRGTNHLICVTEDDMMFKSWIRDVMEAVKPASKTGKYGVPAKQREIGTSAYRKYAQSMVPGQGEIKNFDIKEFLNKYKIKK